MTTANKAPTGGSVYAKWWITAKVNGMAYEQANQAYEGTKTFP